MPKTHIQELLTRINAVITNSHVVYTSGKHGSTYVNKDAIYPHTEATSELCLEIAHHFLNLRVDVVLAPAVGGVILSQWVAYHLTRLNKREVLGVYAEKSENSQNFVIKRGYDLLCRSKRVLVVEDIITTGGSVRKVVEAARAIPCEIIGVAALCNRGGQTNQTLGEVPELFSLTELAFDAWDEQDCVLCKNKIPINTQVGKGREYLAKNSSSPAH